MAAAYSGSRRASRVPAPPGAGVMCVPPAQRLTPGSVTEAAAGSPPIAAGWAFGRPAGHERVAVHVERTGVVLAFGAAERVDGLADHHVRESAVLQHLLPARTGQPAGYSTGPQVDVAQRPGWYGAAVGDVSELEPPARAQHPMDLGEHRLLVGAQVDDPVRDHHVRPTVLDRERLGEPLPELDVAEAEGLGGLACLG